MDDLVRGFLQRTTDYDEDGLTEIDAYDLDGYSKLGGWIARLSSIEVFVIADEDRFDRDGYIQDLSLLPRYEGLPFFQTFHQFFFLQVRALILY